MSKLELIAVLFASKALLAKIAAQQDPSDALERLKRAVDDVSYANDKDEPND